MAGTDFKIYRYREPWQLPQSLDVHPGSIIFDEGKDLTKRLPKYSTIYLGERRKSVYYDRYDKDTQQYAEPIVQVVYGFKRDEKGLVTEKVRNIQWYLESGNLSPDGQLDIIPITEDATKLKEIERRRSNLINELKGLAKKFSTDELNLEIKIPEIFEKYQLEKGMYVDAGSARFRDAIASDNTDWLDETIVATGNTSRQVLTQYLSIGLAV